MLLKHPYPFAPHEPFLDKDSMEKNSATLLKYHPLTAPPHNPARRSQGLQMQAALTPAAGALEYFEDRMRARNAADAQEVRSKQIFNHPCRYFIPGRRFS